MITVNCIECGKSFEAQRKSAKFCSSLCRVKWNKKDSDSLLKEVEMPDTPPPIEHPSMEVAPKGNIVLKPSNAKLEKLRKTIDGLNKKYGEGTAMILGDLPNKKFAVVSTGVKGIDDALGIGGFPKGRIVEIYGPESSGKTSIALSTIAQAQKSGLNCAFIDAEHSFDDGYARLLGVDTENLILIQPDFGEAALDAAENFVVNGEADVVVVDSVAALIPKAELEGEMGDSKIGLQARLMSQAMRKLVSPISRSNAVVIFINQLRDKIGVMFGSPETTTGGNALKYYASVRLDVRKIGQIKDGDEVRGNKVRVRVAKSKVSAPFKTTEFDFIYGIGIDTVGSIIDIALNKGILDKSGSWYSYKDIKVGQGREQTRQFLLSNPKIFEEINEALK